MNGGADERVDDDGRGKRGGREDAIVCVSHSLRLFIFAQTQGTDTASFLFPPSFTLLKLELPYQLLLGKESH